MVSVAGQMIVGFGLALLLNRTFPFKGLVTTLLLLPMMMSMAVVGPVLEAALRSVLGHHQLCLPASAISPGCPIRDAALFAIAITDIWMWSPFVMLLSLAGLSAVPKYLYEAAAIDRAGNWYTFTRITLPLVAPILLIAHDLPHDGSVQDLRHRLHHVEPATRRK